MISIKPEIVSEKLIAVYSNYKKRWLLKLRYKLTFSSPTKAKADNYILKK